MNSGEQTQGERAREKKREQFSKAAANKSRSRLVVITVFIALAGAVIYAVFDSSERSSNSGATATADSLGGVIRIPVADVSSGKAKFFKYTLSSNKPIRFFVIRSSDGVYRSALDACDVCFHSKKGYHQEGDDMVCNNCGLHFHSALINKVSGGCNPVGFSIALQGDYLVVRASDLEIANAYF